MSSSDSEPKSLSFGVCGLGTVASGVLETWRANQRQIQQAAGRKLDFRQLGARRNRHNHDLAGIDWSQDIFAPARNPELDVVIELIGGLDPAFDLIMTALEHGKHVITANKALLAERGEELFAQASKYQRQLRFEASVAGGIPIIKSITEALAANKISSVYGIINGTGNYILSKMDEDKLEFADALRQAQDLGYAEADPSFDVDGFDAMHKIVILARLALQARIETSQVYCHGIRDINPDDVAFARELGYSLKAVAHARLDPGTGAVAISSQPLLLAQDSPLAAVRGVSNALMLECEPMGGLFLVGAGAGAGPTASAVLADLLDLSRGQDYQTPAYAQPLEPATVLSGAEQASQFFLCLHVLDRIGVLNRISQLLLEHDISVRNLIQKPAELDGEQIAMVALLTHPVQESELTRALTALQTLPELQDRRVHSMRVLGNNQVSAAAP